MRQVSSAIIAMVLFLGMLCAVGYIETHYTRKDCEVIAVGRVEDRCGFVWECDTEGHRVGDRVNLKMHTNGTDGTIYDDYVLDVE